MQEVSESWRSGLSCFRYVGVLTPIVTILFGKNTENAVKINNSPHSPQKDVRNTR